MKMKLCRNGFNSGGDWGMLVVTQCLNLDLPGLYPEKQGLFLRLSDYRLAILPWETVDDVIAKWEWNGQTVVLQNADKEELCISSEMMGKVVKAMDLHVVDVWRDPLGVWPNPPDLKKLFWRVIDAIKGIT